MIKVRTHETAKEFLRAALPGLEARESANSLMLGICGQLIENPERFRKGVCLKTVEENDALLLAATMTPPHKLLLAGKTDRAEECVDALVNSLIREGWNIPGVIGPVETARRTAEGLAAVLKKNCRLDQNLRLYELTNAPQAAPADGFFRKASAADLEGIIRWWYEARLEMMGKADPQEAKQSATYRLKDGDVYIWEAGKPVSMASTTRPTKHGISIGMVFTPPAFRRRGYATACVTELSRRLLREGRAYCALYADLANPTSNSMYRKIGYRPIGDFQEYALA